ncbi:MAG: hypothetical protein Q9170_008264 [Blastenia crenularia]
MDPVALVEVARTDDNDASRTTVLLLTSPTLVQRPDWSPTSEAATRTSVEVSDGRCWDRTSGDGGGEWVVVRAWQGFLDCIKDLFENFAHVFPVEIAGGPTGGSPSAPRRGLPVPPLPAVPAEPSPTAGAAGPTSGAFGTNTAAKERVDNCMMTIARMEQK